MACFLAWSACNAVLRIAVWDRQFPYIWSDESDANRNQTDRDHEAVVETHMAESNEDRTKKCVRALTRPLANVLWREYSSIFCMVYSVDLSGRYRDVHGACQWIVQRYARCAYSCQAKSRYLEFCT